MARARAQLEVSAWEAAWELGASMTPPEAIEYGLELTARLIDDLR